VLKSNKSFILILPSIFGPKRTKENPDMNPTLEFFSSMKKRKRENDV